MKAFKYCAFACRFIAITQGSFLQKIQKTIKFTQLYHHHSHIQSQIKRQNLTYFNQRKSMQKEETVGYYKNMMNRYFQVREKIKQKRQEGMESMKEQSIRESLIKNTMRQGFEKLSLFYESLQALVEGRREVLQNGEFVFEDGLTVKQKRVRFQRFIQRFFGKKPQSPKEDISME